MGDCIYFDNAATTFPKPEKVYRAMDEAGRSYAVNAGRGSYALAKKAAAVIDEVREQIKCLAGANQVAEVVLTASATLACNQILGGLEWSSQDVVYVSPFEHNAIMRVLHHYQEQHGFAVEELAVCGEGVQQEAEQQEHGAQFAGGLRLDLEKIRFQFSRKRPSVLIMSHVSNVTGYILPILEVARMAEEYNAITIIDGSQALGLVPFSLKNMPIDFYVFAGHKTLYGPFGTGGFLQTGKRKLKPFLAGGTGTDSRNLDMPSTGTLAFEPGSPNVVALAGLHAALENFPVEEIFHREQELTAKLIHQLAAVCGVKLYCPPEGQQVGIVAFNIEGYKASDVGMLLDEDYGIAVRTGYQCAPLIHRYLGSEEYAGVVRAGLGRFTTEEEIRLLVKAVREIAEG